MSINIITLENRRLYPALVYHMEDTEYKKPMTDVNDIYDLLYKRQNILVLSNQYDQYGKELKYFHGLLEKSDIKALFNINNENNNTDLNSVMTLSEAAKKWGLANGSTIRKAIERGKFENNEIKQAGDVWITTYSAMERVFGTIKNEEKEYILYDDFETIYVGKAYIEYAMTVFFKDPVLDVKAKELELEYQYIKEMLLKGLNAIKMNQKVIIKRSRNNQIKQVIYSEDEYFMYIEGFRSRKNLYGQWIDRLLKDLKNI